MHPQLVDLEEAAALVGLTAQTLRRYTLDGRVPGARVGGQWRYFRPALLESMAGPEAAETAKQLPPGWDEPQIVTAPELAELLGIHPQTVAVLLREGALPATKAGTRWRAYWPAIRDRIAVGAPLTTRTPEQDEP